MLAFDMLQHLVAAAQKVGGKRDVDVLKEEMDKDDCQRSISINTIQHKTYIEKNTKWNVVVWKLGEEN